VPGRRGRAIGNSSLKAFLPMQQYKQVVANGLTPLPAAGGISKCMINGLDHRFITERLRAFILLEGA
jgi:hypothetical protein